VGIAFVMRYARRLKASPERSIVAKMAEENRSHFLKGAADTDDALPRMTPVRSIILILFGLTFAWMIYGVVFLGWWMAEMSALFLLMSIVIWIVGRLDAASRMDEHGFVDAFVDGARDLLGVALIIGVARGVVVMMDAGKITDTILHSAEGMVTGLSETRRPSRSRCPCRRASSRIRARAAAAPAIRRQRSRRPATTRPQIQTHDRSGPRQAFFGQAAAR
jgi:uncharacterized ion transporter superfamily protein YfcC